jgi:hypothetical protein
MQDERVSITITAMNEAKTGWILGGHNSYSSIPGDETLATVGRNTVPVRE